MNSVHNILEKANKFGIEGKIWQKGDKLRIYAKSPRRDINIYLELDGSADDIYGGELKIFINTDQHPNWIASQKKMYAELYKPLFYAYVIETYKNANLESYGSDIRAMIDEARVFDARYIQ